ncbi:MAG TPA: hypothetical protein VFB29_10295 [Pseudolabrys sp.]|nr:hypothetical protein [Pseudolabrys sp.]
MRLDGINASQFQQARQDPGSPNHADDSTGPESRALVALAPLPDGRGALTGHRYAPFLAHLVATKDQHPQTRERRRADMSDALTAYRTAAALGA